MLPRGGRFAEGERTMEQQGHILNGDLATLGLQATLKMLALGGHTGVLSVESGQERMQIALRAGTIAALDEPGSHVPDLIEVFRLLGRLGRLSRQEIGQLYQMAGNNPITTILILEQWGLVGPDEIQRRVEFGIIQAVSRAIRWEHGSFEFQKDISPIQARLGGYQPLNVDHVLLDALRVADERDHAGALALARTTVPRWMPRFNGNVSQLGLGHDEVQVLRLSNGQLALSTISYGLLLPEPVVAAILQRLLQLGLIELVDAQLEAELEHNLINLLTQSQYQLTQNGRASPEQRMLLLVRTLGNCVNGLLAHHATFARALRGRGAVAPAEAIRYIETTFQPLLRQMQHAYPRMDEIIRFTGGHLDFADVESLNRVVRGQELTACYWDAVRLLYQFARQASEFVLADEAGHSRAGRQFGDMWAAFLREIDEEMRRLSAKYAPARA